MDELAEPTFTRPRWLGELIGLLLVGLWVGTSVLIGRQEPPRFTPGEGLPTLLGGVNFLVLGAIGFASYFLPSWSVIFRFLSWSAENLPGTMGGRSGLLFIGGLFGLSGFVLLVVGSGVFS